MLLRIEAVSQIGADFLLQIVVVGLIEFRRSNFAFRLSGLRTMLVDRGTNLLDFGVRKFDRVNYRLFLHFFRARLDHHDTFSRPDYHDVDKTPAQLAVAGISGELAVHEP